MKLDDDGDSALTSGATSARGRVLRYLLLGLLTALTAGGLASWVRSRSKTEHWQSAPTGWNVHTHESAAVADLVTVPEPAILSEPAILPEPAEQPEVVDVTAADPVEDQTGPIGRSDLTR